MYSSSDEYSTKSVDWEPNEEDKLTYRPSAIKKEVVLVEQLNDQQDSIGENVKGTHGLMHEMLQGLDEEHPHDVSMDDERHHWKSQVLGNHDWVKEVHDRVHPYHRTLQFVRSYDPIGKANIKQRLEQDNENIIVQIVLQHLLFEGLKHTKSALCEALGSEYRNIDVDGSLLYELVKEAIKKSDNLTDLVMDDLPEQGRVDIATIEQQLLDLGFEEEQAEVHDLGDWSVWDEMIELNVVFDERRFTNVHSRHATDLQTRIITHASLNVLILRLTSVTPLEYTKLERIWQGPHKPQLSILKEVKKFFPDVDDWEGTDNMESFVDIFLMTFPSFATQDVFLTKMMDCFHVPKYISDQQVELIQKAVFRVLHQYIVKYASALTTQFVDKLLMFLKEKEDLGYYDASHVLNALESSLSSSERNQRIKVEKSKCPKPLYPHTLLRHNFQWNHVNPQEIARQLTLIDFEYFNKIQSSEFLNLAWSKPRLKHRAPNLLRMIDRFNRISRWVSSVIILPKQLSERRRIYGIVLSIMDHLLQIGNFSSLMAFLGALSNSSVKRLRRTCTNPPPALANKLKHIRHIMSSQSNHIVYRNTIQQRREQRLPTIPFLGFGQSTLTMAEEGNTSESIPNPYASNSESVEERRIHRTLINWEKKSMLHSIIERMLFFQEFPFHFHSIHQVQIELTRLREEVSSEKELHKLSMEHGNEADDKHFDK